MLRLSPGRKDETLPTLFSPAKLTKYLKVTGVRPDGMHELESEMVSLSFGDTLELSEGDGIEVFDVMGALAGLEVGLNEIPVDGSNLISKALKIVGQTALVRLYKRIPPGTGLGGGSSNAAAIVRYFGDIGSLQRAFLLGADVPYCVRGGRAIVRGIGEILDPLPYEMESFVLLISPFGVSTKQVYGRFDLEQRDFDDAVNHLELAAQLCDPRLTKSKDALRRLSGADPVLAGSGSTYFVRGTFDDLDLTRQPEVGERFRYLDVVVDGTGYRLIETSTIPELS